jgi:hypothetical protein
MAVKVLEWLDLIWFSISDNYFSPDFLRIDSSILINEQFRCASALRSATSLSVSLSIVSGTSSTFLLYQLLEFDY